MKFLKKIIMIKNDNKKNNIMLYLKHGDINISHGRKFFC